VKERSVSEVKCRKWREEVKEVKEEVKEVKEGRRL
jgi:hypothetical protein